MNNNDETIIKQRTSGRSVRAIAKAQGTSATAVDEVTDHLGGVDNRRQDVRRLMADADAEAAIVRGTPQSRDPVPHRLAGRPQRAVTAALDHLKALSIWDGKAVYVLGNSMGTRWGPEAAAADRRIRGLAFQRPAPAALRGAAVGDDTTRLGALPIAV